MREIVGREAVSVRRPEKETRPKLFYKGAHQATLDPLAARRPDGGMFLWSEQGSLPHQVTSGHPGAANSSAAALLAYDVPHRMPWDWRLSLYTWTKGIAAGAYLVALCAGSRRRDLRMRVRSGASRRPWSPARFWRSPALILIADLEHPERFWLIFARPQWRSWLVRGAFIIAGYAAVLLLHFAGELRAGCGRARSACSRSLGLPLATMTAVYTAYLFAQAKARDLWQNPLLPPHLLVQAVLAGAAAMLPAPALLEPAALGPLAWMLGASSLLHLLFVLGEVTLTHPTAHARLAVEEMTVGAYRGFFWLGVVLVALARGGTVDRRAGGGAGAGRPARVRARLRAGRAVGAARLKGSRR